MSTLKESTQLEQTAARSVTRESAMLAGPVSAGRLVYLAGLPAAALPFVQRVIDLEREVVTLDALVRTLYKRLDALEQKI